MKCLLLRLGLVFCVVSLGIYSGDRLQAKDFSTTNNKHHMEKKMSDSNVITIELETGTVTIELYPDVAPKTVESFKRLISKGFYDGLTFHRVIPGFMAQAGDPEGTGMGGPGFSLKAEFNDKKHVRGTLAMARSSDPDSAGSQFYICYGPQPHLDGQYTIFGQVTDGMDLIDDVKNGTVMKKFSIVESGE
ncbi:MAG: peptidylprolyl isomerase [Ghiorsea sp.]|nr:peptidylprolyl isomerase [Ghiorsea sp.]